MTEIGYFLSSEEHGPGALLEQAELPQERPMPGHFDQESKLVSVDDVKESLARGPDPERHVESLKEYLDAGFDELYVNQISPDQAGFFDFFDKEVRPRP